MNWILKLAASLTAGFIAGLAATAILQPYVYFSLFLGIPAGALVAALTYLAQNH